MPKKIDKKSSFLHNSDFVLRTSNLGFTLIELLVYIAIFAIIIVVVVSFVIWLAHSSTKSRVERETLDNAQRIMRFLTKEIKEAKSIYTPTTTLSQISLETTKGLPEGENTTFVNFYLCDSRLCVKKESQDPGYLTLDNVEITNLVFTPIIPSGSSSSSVRIDLAVNYKNPENRQEYRSSVNLTSTVSLRSY